MTQNITAFRVDRISLVADGETPAVRKSKNEFAIFKSFKGENPVLISPLKKNKLASISKTYDKRH